MGREHFIPVRKDELIERLAETAEAPGEERDLFRQFCRLLSAMIHREYHARHETLKDAYAPFDPDADTKPLTKLRAEERQERLNEIFRDFAWLLERADYTHLSCDDLEPALTGASDWGIHTDVDFRVFERMAIFVRGDACQRRTRRRLGNWYRVEQVDLPIYQRLVLILKLRPHPRLGKNVDTNNVHLKVFKDIPKLDINMLLPGARVHFRMSDRGKMGVSLLSGFALLFWKLIGFGVGLLDDVLGIVGNPTLAVWGLTTGAIGYGYRSYYGYQQTKQRYHLNLTQSLYFQNLDSNSGVLYRLLDEAEEQVCREAILAFYCLWRRGEPEGSMIQNLNCDAEKRLEQLTGTHIDFQVDAALAKLEGYEMVEKIGERFRAIALQHGIETIKRLCYDRLRE